jgi:hypothetical protein
MSRLSLLVAVLFCLPVFALMRKDPSEYPLKVHILQQNWSSHNNYSNVFKGVGRGNIWEGDSIHAFDYSYECYFRLSRTARNQPYMAKWKKPHVRLALIASQIGQDNKYQECTLKTTVHEGIYFLGGGGISEISQQEYQERKAKWEQARTEQGNTPAPAAVSRLSVASTPDSAEIEVDGEFVGNTPSVLELDPGEHNVTVRKTGYKAWEKNIKLTAGEIKLNAELEPDGPK